ncbi:MAG TPA: hypothetical protein VNI84_13600 [Pyrinomonadaceae bacterium]|nr:hypothetical protein [Pyrinomonadaceae bacterium]
MRKQILLTSIAGITTFVALTGGCGSMATNTANANRASMNAVNANTANANSSPVASPTAVAASPKIETNEPEEYSATLQLTARTTGKNTSLPSLTANVAREGEKRRVAFNLPNNEQVVYLNLGSTRYLILPNRKQYAELSANSVGFEMPRLMMPDQIVDYLKGREGFERVGEEQFNGRATVKYRAAGTTQTNSPAGRVNAESYTYVDKETGLPLRAEFESQASGNVQGVEGLKAVVEMRDIKTETAPALFEVPVGYNKITEEQIRSQVNAVTQAVTAIAGAVLNNMNAQKPAASPAASPGTR